MRFFSHIIHHHHTHVHARMHTETDPPPVDTTALNKEVWLRYCPAGVWIVGNTESKEKNESHGIKIYARSKKSGQLPSDPVTWTDRNLVVQPDMRVVCFSRSKWAEQRERLESEAMATKVCA